jgi:Protein of unknown function (DUF2795)
MTRRRESGKHGPRLDDQLKREVEPLTHGKRGDARPEEDPEREGIPEDEPELEAEGYSVFPSDPALARREISRHLRPSVFPADRAALLAEADENEAPDHVQELLAELPDDTTYATVYEVWEALGGETEPVPHGRPERIRKSR